MSEPHDVCAKEFDKVLVVTNALTGDRMRPVHFGLRTPKHNASHNLTLAACCHELRVAVFVTSELKLFAPLHAGDGHVEEVDAQHGDPMHLGWMPLFSEGMSFYALSAPGPVRVVRLAVVLDLTGRR